MAFLFDMKRLHHGCGESLVVRPFKPQCKPVAKAKKGRFSLENFQPEDKPTGAIGRPRNARRAE